MAERKRNEPPKHATSMEIVGDRELVISRTFRAPARLVFDAWTRSDLVRLWWAPRSRGVQVVDIAADVRPGGAWRYQLEAHGSPVVFSGQYTEVTPPTRLVYTLMFEQNPSPPVVVTITFTDVAEGTRLVSRELYPSAEVRDIVLATGMEEGMRETLDQLDELVASMA